MRFVLILAALAALQLPSASAAPEDVLATVRARGVLRVGTTGDYQPFSLRGPEGRFAGLDIEMAESFARSLGVRAEFVPTSWPNLMQDLAADRFDLAAGGISVTAERQRQAGFSLPYLTDGKTPIARCEHRSRFATLEDIDRPASVWWSIRAAPTNVSCAPGSGAPRWRYSRTTWASSTRSSLAGPI